MHDPGSCRSRRAEQIVVLSARSPERLAASVDTLARFLDRGPDVDLADLAYTLQIAREALPERYAVVVSTTAELLSTLRSGRGHRGTVRTSDGPLTGLTGDGLQGGLSKVAALWTSGAEVDWERLHAGAPRRVVPLPTRPGLDELVTAVVREKIARALSRKADELDGGLALADQGLDPMRAMRVVHQLNNALSLNLPTSVVFDFTTADRLSAHLLSEYGDVIVPTGDVPETASAPGPRVTERPAPAPAVAPAPLASTPPPETAPPSGPHPAPSLPHPTAPSPPSTGPDGLTALLLDRAAAVLGVPVDRIDPSAPLADHGRHSLLVLRLAGALREDFGYDIPATALLGIESIDDLCAHLRARSAGPAGERWNLSRGQLTMYRDQRRCPESAAYNLPLLFEVHGDLDEAALERAVRAQTEIHPVLSAVFGERAGVPYMAVDPARTPSFDRVHIAAVSRAAQLARLRELVDVPFDLATGPLVRTHLVALPGRRRLLLITAHHILLDGTSTAVLVRTLKAAYRGERHPNGASYGDFVAWEEELLAGPLAARHRDYWLRELEGPRTALALPYDRPYDPRRLPRVAVVTRKLSPALVTALTDTAREHRVSVATVFFATYVRFLRRLTGQDDLVLGLTTAARYDQRFKDVVGQFANCLPLRCTDTGGFRELLKSVQRKMVAAIEHGAYPLLEIARSLGADDEPLVLTNFLFQNFEGAELLTNGSPSGPGELDLRLFDDLPYAGEYALSMELYRDGEGYKAFLKYDTNLFDEATAQKLMDEWRSLAENIPTQRNEESAWRRT
ncbi:condensation domain-containing protein [Streptomyces sp. NPDC057623]|uniref:condensation domain-containing protein n=1 Tax=Streptomyces sp. NPDC057623 TaxID=3346187 RepID=UPI0036A4BA33